MKSLSSFATRIGRYYSSNIRDINSPRSSNTYNTYNQQQQSQQPQPQPQAQSKQQQQPKRQHNKHQRQHQQPFILSQELQEKLSTLTSPLVVDSDNTNNLKMVMESLWNWRWIKSSKEQMEHAEKRILQTIETPYEQRMVKVGDHEINTIKVGSGDPLVLVHGYGAGVGFWCGNIDYLARHYTVYAIDLVGFGRSSRPDPTQFKTPDDAEKLWVDSINQWASEVGLDNFHLLGHSLGGYISTCYTLQHPERVKSLVLADPWGFAIRPDDFETRVPLPFKILGKIVRQSPLSLLRAVGPFGPDLVYRFRSDLLQKFSHLYPEDELKYNQQQPNRVAEYIYHSNAQAPATGEYLFSLLSLPFGWAANPMLTRSKAIDPLVDVTVLHGSNSWLDKTIGDQLKQDMKNIKDVVIIERSGHHIYIDNANQFHSAILSATANNKHSSSMSPSDRRQQLFGSEPVYA
ncbi:hypothetical protein SAMD00019534_023360 [Acytostelium subglobosum LB1]|uniref:hypothetical protein n=1 Tax=Acytostelium subglobosum LB1 TaxID=1410327 RepID=UPI000644F835|nr:hypothetical protein SAMD00019534_023360 [Acytostelium subglobosum LB1]GAM19161.1 hypothetical protein SAMD00019534_023360 [Acytostelium subglobosum LB1]|eukprot:XP_012757088.1 hypothetical protein SAMD00019534_023360 [Acytostelium subglobosum LB1]